MFKQFTENIDGKQVYLISSMGIFILFFLMVGFILIRLRKAHVQYMSELPLKDSLEN